MKSKRFAFLTALFITETIAGGVFIRALYRKAEVGIARATADQFAGKIDASAKAALISTAYIPALIAALVTGIVALCLLVPLVREIYRRIRLQIEMQHWE
jgi:UPF0716 family protein affecting phage T7 exclusion